MVLLELPPEPGTLTIDPHEHQGPVVTHQRLSLKVSQRLPKVVHVEPQRKIRAAPKGGLSRPSPPILSQQHALDPARALPSRNRMPYKLLPRSARGMSRSLSTSGLVSISSASGHESEHQLLLQQPNTASVSSLPPPDSLRPSASLPQLQPAPAKLQPPHQPPPHQPPPHQPPPPPPAPPPPSSQEALAVRRVETDGSREVDMSVDVTAGASVRLGGGSGGDATVSALSPPPPTPLLLHRERVAALRAAPLLSTLEEPALQQLAAAAVEKECKKYHSLRPTRSVCILVYGQLEPKEGAHLLLTGPTPPELLTTAAAVTDPTCASAAAAVTIDGAVAGTAGERGATLGLPNLLGGLVTSPPAFLALQPSLLLQLPLEPLLALMPSALMAHLGTEARLRMLLAHPAFAELSPPVPEMRHLASLTRLEAATDHARILSAGEPCDQLRILMHGRVDICDADGQVLRTCDRTMTPPLGETPPADGSPPRPQPYTALAAESGCLLVCGGADAADAAFAIMAVAHMPADSVAARAAADAKAKAAEKASANKRPPGGPAILSVVEQLVATKAAMA